MYRPTVRLNTIFLALGGFAAVALPFAVRAQSGEALARAERTCLDYGIEPMTMGYRACVANETSMRRYEITYLPRSGVRTSGLHYDADGVLRDRNGDRVPPVYQ
jgi:hypothetical protein